MKQRSYTKLHKIFGGSKALNIQMTDGYVYISNAEIIVRIPATMYTEWCIVRPDLYPVVESGDKVTATDGKAGVPGIDLQGAWEKCFNSQPGALSEIANTGKWVNIRVQMIASDSDRVMIQGRYFDAMKQAGGCYRVYAGLRQHPVWFYDDEVYNAAFSALVLPIYYRGGGTA